MNDKKFLIWIHERLQYIHGENKNVDYMHKLRSIIESIDEEQITPNVSSIDLVPSGIPQFTFAFADENQVDFIRKVAKQQDGTLLGNEANKVLAGMGEL